MKDYRVIALAQKGSELDEKGLARMVWAHCSSKKKANWCVEQLRETGVEAYVEVKESKRDGK